MIATSPAEFLRAYGDGSAFPARRPAVMRAAMLVSPVGFRISEQSAADNAYMVASRPLDPERAAAQHSALLAKLGALGVPVILFPGREGLDDAVFPNNAFAAIPRRLIVGSMRHPVRRAEAEREDIRSLFVHGFGYELRDLSKLPVVAELTGPLVLDRPRGIGFCGLTGRCDPPGCAAMHDAFALELTFRFELAAGEYHTNLVLSALAGRACVIHPGSFVDPEVPAAIARLYPDAAVELSDEEKAAFAGNCLAVTERDVLLSATSLRSLRAASAAVLERRGFRLHSVEIDELEKGGGSLRCLIAEVF
jgi:hypothetical protein